MLKPEQLTWTILLTKWIDFAKSAVALPDDDEGNRMRDSIADIINLQAVTFALADLDQLASEDRPIARDKADILITSSAARLREIWNTQHMPAEILTLIQDARITLDRSIYAGTIELRWAGDQPVTMPTITLPNPNDNPDATGTLAVMMPGTRVMPNEPVAWYTDRPAPDINLAPLKSVPTNPPRQVYRQINEDGIITNDLVAPITDDLPPGMPLLVPILADGQHIGQPTMDPDQWTTMQKNAMPEDSIPVKEIEDSA